MKFQEQIDQDLKEAMKARQAERLAVLRMLKAALKNASIEKGGADERLQRVGEQGVLRPSARSRPRRK